MRRVAVTGLGVVSGFGAGVEPFWTGLREGRSAIRSVESCPPGHLRFPNGAEVSGFQPLDHFSEKRLTTLDKFAQFGVVAAREAVRESGLVVSGERSAIVTGSCAGGQGAMDEGFLDLYRKGLPRVNPMMIPRVMGNSAASAISMEFGVSGPVFNVSTACSSANHAIGQAFWMVRSGQVDLAIAGGCEAIFSYGFLKAWEAMRVIAPDTCRPFCKDRKGLILGEGAAMLVLEPLESARARGAPILGEIAGFGMSSDAHHITQPLPQGAASAMRQAIRDGGIEPGSVGYVNAHGTGTVANDVMEAAAIECVFGDHVRNVAVSSTKSAHGHALGAAGALEAAATMLGLRHGLLPATVNFTEQDPECRLDVVINHPRETRCDYALSNSFAFGGLNAVLLFKSPNGL